MMENLLQGISGVVVYLNDILITCHTRQEQMSNFKEVLERLEQSGLRLKCSKCAFLQPKVDYLGYIDKERLHTVHTKVTAIVEAPSPKNVHKVRAFLGTVNYYGRFISRLSTIAHPLDRLLCKSICWDWNKECKHAFEVLKAKMASTKVMAHYDHMGWGQCCHIHIIWGGASAVAYTSYGVGPVLSHTHHMGWGQCCHIHIIWGGASAVAYTSYGVGPVLSHTHHMGWGQCCRIHIIWGGASAVAYTSYGVGPVLSHTHHMGWGQCCCIHIIMGGASAVTYISYGVGPVLSHTHHMGWGQCCNIHIIWGGASAVAYISYGVGPVLSHTYHMGWGQCCRIHILMGQKEQLHMLPGPSAWQSGTMPKLRKRVWL